MASVAPDTRSLLICDPLFLPVSSPPPSPGGVAGSSVHGDRAAPTQHPRRWTISMLTQKYLKEQQNAAQRISDTEELASIFFWRRNFSACHLYVFDGAFAAYPGIPLSKQQAACVKGERANSITLAFLCQGGLRASHRGRLLDPIQHPGRPPATSHSAGEGVGSPHQATLTPPAWLGAQLRDSPASDTSHGVHTSDSITNTRPP